MTILNPALTLIVLLATASATLAHVLWGKRWLQIPIFLLAAMMGSLISYVVGLRLPHNLPEPAGVPVLETVLAAWVLIIIASRLRV